MKIVIAGGKHEADFIVKMFKEDHHDLIVINQDRKFAEYISEKNNVSVFPGDPTKAYTFEDAESYGADVVIALSEKDTDNYVTCITAKTKFNVKKCISIVRNPKNVEIFRKLGIESVISSTYMLGQIIRNEASMRNITRTLPLEEEKIVVIEVMIEEDYALVNKPLKKIVFPKNINISCIFRDPHVIIPTGDTMIRAYDKLIVISTPKDQDEIISFLQKKRR
ncbi:MAG: potassium channel family protein [Acholeplasmataceae bacterium]